MVGVNILLVGCGKMGRAMLDGWLRADICQKIYVVDPSVKLDHEKVVCLKEAPNDLDVDVIVFAVKPQILESIASDYFSYNCLFVSIAAGKSISFLSLALKKEEAHIIRVMPNTPAAIGLGISGLFANDKSNAEDKVLAERLLAVCGDVVWLKTEDDMHAVTALSGSGPAYLFHFIEAMTQAGVGMGLKYEDANLLARKTIEGAAALSSSSDCDAQTLREAVTSPNGTTQAGLEVLMPRLTPLLMETVEAAKDRSIELDN